MNIHPESFGTRAFYSSVITLVHENKHLRRKVSRLLNKLRRQLRPWSHIDRDTQITHANKDAIQALKDTKLPDDVKSALQHGMELEFQFKF